MRKITTIILVIIFTTTIAGCKKARQRILHGSIIEANTKKPIINSRYVLAVTSYAQGITGTEKIKEYPFTTDNNGNFRFMFEATGKESLMIGYPGSTIYWSKAIGRKDLEIDAGTIEDSR